jgi:hypothetical protein
MNTKTFVGKLRKTTFTLVVDIDKVNMGKFEPTISSVPFPPKMEVDEYISWIKSVMLQIAADSGKKIAYGGRTGDGWGYFLGVCPNGKVTEKWK